jgi:hypothetical protein
MELKRLCFISFLPVSILLLVNVLHQTAFAESKGTLNETLIQYGSRFEKLGSLPVLRDFQQTARGKIFHTVLAQDQDTHIEIEIISPLEEGLAINYSNSKYEIIKDLYGPQIIPYPGAITDTTDCPMDKRPKEATVDIMGKTIKVLLANASERYVLGVWDDELIKQKAAFAVFYDEKNKTNYQIIVFQPVRSFNQEEVLGTLRSFQVIKKLKP